MIKWLAKGQEDVFELKYVGFWAVKTIWHQHMSVI